MELGLPNWGIDIYILGLMVLRFSFVEVRKHRDAK
jgi:hypothetical protein